MSFRVRFAWGGLLLLGFAVPGAIQARGTHAAAYSGRAGAKSTRTNFPFRKTSSTSLTPLNCVAWDITARRRNPVQWVDFKTRGT